MRCWKCQKELEKPQGHLSFRATCDHCFAWLHVCKNCRFYKPGRTNDCLVPGTLPISDRESSNHCEEFALKEKEDQPCLEGSSDKLAKLLGDEEGKEKKAPPKDHFNDLFRD